LLAVPQFSFYFFTISSKYLTQYPFLRCHQP